jgi:hypothetical protein
MRCLFRQSRLIKYWRLKCRLFCGCSGAAGGRRLADADARHLTKTTRDVNTSKSLPSNRRPFFARSESRPDPAILCCSGKVALNVELQSATGF